MPNRTHQKTTPEEIFNELIEWSPFAFAFGRQWRWSAWMSESMELWTQGLITASNTQLQSQLPLLKEETVPVHQDTPPATAGAEPHRPPKANTPQIDKQPSTPSSMIDTAPDEQPILATTDNEATSVMTLKGVGPANAAKLTSIQITTLSDIRARSLEVFMAECEQAGIRNHKHLSQSWHAQAAENQA